MQLLINWVSVVFHIQINLECRMYAQKLMNFVVSFNFNINSKVLHLRLNIIFRFMQKMDSSALVTRALQCLFMDLIRLISMSVCILI